jgi:hypothetical protein
VYTISVYKTTADFTTPARREGEEVAHFSTAQQRSRLKPRTDL